MNYYFFPKINGLDSSVVLTNFPCLDKFKLIDKTQTIYATWSENDKWLYRDIGKIKKNECVEVVHSKLPKDIPESPFIFFSHRDVPESSQELVLSDHMFYMPTWRANIKIFSKTTASSYQGDYQHEMVKFIKKGSLVSLTPMMQSAADVENYFVFANVMKAPEIQTHEMHFYDPIRKTILHTSTVTNNACNVVNLSEVSFPADTPILVISKTIAGIPIFVSCNKARTQISFEHTHPPASLVVFGEPIHFQRNFKSHWLQAIEA